MDKRIILSNFKIKHARNTYMLGWAILCHSGVARNLEASVFGQLPYVYLQWFHWNDQRWLFNLCLYYIKIYIYEYMATFPTYRVGVCLPFRRFAIMVAWLKNPRVITDGFKRHASPSTCIGTDILVVMRAVLHWHNAVPVPPVCNLV